MNEEWRSIPGYEGLYESSNLGRVRRLIHRVGHTRRPYTEPPMVKPRPNEKGYLRVELTDAEGRRHKSNVHRLVLMAFDGLPPTAKHEAAHLDGDRRNNIPSNLCWATPKENSSHRLKHGTAHIGVKHPAAKLNDQCVVAIRRAFAGGMTMKALAREYGVHDTTIYRVVYRKGWRHVG